MTLRTFVAFLVLIAEINSAVPDFDLERIFQVPKKRKYDELEIIERSNFDDSESNVDNTGKNNNQSIDMDKPKSYANAQILLKFGGGLNTHQSPDVLSSRCQYPSAHSQAFYFPTPFPVYQSFPQYPCVNPNCNGKCQQPIEANYYSEHKVNSDDHNNQQTLMKTSQIENKQFARETSDAIESRKGGEKIYNKARNGLNENDLIKEVIVIEEIFEPNHQKLTPKSLNFADFGNTRNSKIVTNNRDELQQSLVPYLCYKGDSKPRNLVTYPVFNKPNNLPFDNSDVVNVIQQKVFETMLSQADNEVDLNTILSTMNSDRRPQSVYHSSTWNDLFMELIRKYQSTVLIPENSYGTMVNNNGLIMNDNLKLPNANLVIGGPHGSQRNRVKILYVPILENEVSEEIRYLDDCFCSSCAKYVGELNELNKY